MKKIKSKKIRNSQQRQYVTRWCEKHGYMIDITACASRALKRPYCRRCLNAWRQIPLPFPAVKTE
jgi:hypothetical protein